MSAAFQLKVRFRRMNPKFGVWDMQADGSRRRRLGGYGRVKWSPDGRQLLIVGFSNPCDVTLMDPETGQERPVRIPGTNFRLASN